LVLDKFSSNERGIWIRQYEGSSDELSYAYLVLGHNDKEYKGILQQHGERDWHLEGKLRGDSIQLLVMDSEDIVLGYLQGTIKDSTFQVVFSTSNKLGQRDLMLRRVLKSQPKTECGADKWMKKLEGTLLDGEVTILIQKEEAAQLNGYIYFKREGTTYDLSGICHSEKCKEANVVLTNDLGLHLESLTMFAKTEEEDIEVILGNRLVNQFAIVDKFQMICSTQFFNGNRINYVYPYFDNKGVDHWLEEKVKNWILSFNQNMDPESKEYRLWMDFDLISDKVISGSMTFHDQEGQSIERESFIFDISAGKPVILSDLIEDEEAFQTLIDGAISFEKGRRVSFEPDATREWFLNQPFSYISMRNDGLCFKTGFSSLYGERKIIVPWSIISDHFRRFANIQKMVR
jgi:hypothetical protein